MNDSHEGHTPGMSSFPQALAESRRIIVFKRWNNSIRDYTFFACLFQQLFSFVLSCFFALLNFCASALLNSFAIRLSDYRDKNFCYLKGLYLVESTRGNRQNYEKQNYDLVPLPPVMNFTIYIFSERRCALELCAEKL